ncbi:glycosyltransferase involved in cell wall biosynthesis [Sphingomonas insulae]|uniref:Glycosyltransferase subfamily 4-like N-terminal domain-containing protein n=1 Tax=Sphingomonas insulae TaxID=424800 RepID=A0ABN1I0J7_9SPHN|nr:glycosyltransferase [Sphingomonas insulae]NIJ30706.1 glycosyltransferase involved in cell wall biosynthesis [Sphingomonas insulae]
MRVLTFLHSFEPGGVERVALRLVRRWRAMGIDAPLFMGRNDGALRDEMATDLAYTVPDQPRLGSGWWETLWMIARLPAEIRRTAPDALFCAGNTYTIVAGAMKLRLGRHCPPVVVKISNDLARADMPAPARPFWRWWLRVQARFVDRWVVMDAAILPDVDRYLGPVARTVIPDPAIDTLPPPVARPPRGAGIRYVAVGRLVAQKDPATLVAAFAQAALPADRLTIIGDGPLRARVEQQAQRLGIAGQVVFMGHVPDAATVMRTQDVLLLSSRYEGVPAVLIEALAAGLGIVATDCGAGVRSVLDHGRLGLIVAQGDVDAFAAGIASARTMAVAVDAGREQAQAFTIDAAARRYGDAIRQTVSGPAAY